MRKKEWEKRGFDCPQCGKKQKLRLIQTNEHTWDYDIYYHECKNCSFAVRYLIDKKRKPLPEYEPLTEKYITDFYDSLLKDWKPRCNPQIERFLKQFIK